MSQMQFSKRDAANEVGFVSDPTRITTDRLNILVVDDSPSILALLRSYLLAQGHAVASADDGEQALAMFDRITPDLVLMDIRLRGGMDGLETARALDRDFGVPSLFVSGSLDAETRARAAAARPAGFVDKPYSEAELLGAVRAAFARAAASGGRGRADAPRAAALHR